MLEETIGNGLRSITWELDTFAYADSFDEPASRYRGLTTGLQHTVHVNMNGSALLVHPDVARRQFEADAAVEARQGGDYKPGETDPGPGSGVEEGESGFDSGGGTAVVTQSPRRYFGSVNLNPQTLASQVSEISREVVANLQGIYGANVRISLEIEAVVPDGIPDEQRRAVEEKTRDLKFDQSDFADS